MMMDCNHAEKTFAAIDTAEVRKKDRDEKRVRGVRISNISNSIINRLPEIISSSRVRDRQQLWIEVYSYSPRDDPSCTVDILMENLKQCGYQCKYISMLI